MAKATYEVTGYMRDLIIVKVTAGDKTEFLSLKWDQHIALDEFLKYNANWTAFQMTRPPVTKEDYLSFVGKHGEFEITTPGPPPLSAEQQKRIDDVQEKMRQEQEQMKKQMAQPPEVKKE